MSEETIELTPNSESQKALFLDRDGTLLVDCGNNGDSRSIEVIPGAAEGLELALLAGYRLFMITNQGGVGLGLFSEEEVEACQRRMFELLGIPEGLFTEICIATEPPPRKTANDAGIDLSRKASSAPFAKTLYTPFEPISEEQWRKPSPRFIKEAIARYHLVPEDCFMVGDREADWRCGIAAGIQPIAVRTGADITGEHEAWLAENRIPVFRQFYSFARTL